MKTWRTASLPSPSTRTAVRDGLLVEFAPEHFAPADLTRTPALRGALVAPLLPAGATAAAWTACWIHTGWWPPDRFSALTVIHPDRSDSFVVARVAIPDRDRERVGGATTTTSARTAADLLVLERPELAVEAALRLHDHLGATERVHFARAVDASLRRMGRRNGVERARRFAAALDGYLARRPGRYFATERCELFTR